jgi:aryl-alcohol dehydrogenase-like predicted oxidoreductase
MNLGKTGLEVSRLCLGCMTYGDPAWRTYILGEKEAREHFKKAFDLGINYFDTADMYSDGVSEEVTGRILREMASRDDYVLASKVFFPVAEGPNRGGLSRKHIMAACDASLKRLGLDYIDLYQIHRLDP